VSETCNACDGPLLPATGTVTPALACTGCGRQIRRESSDFEGCWE
jgi:uncharacterized Zn finger protein (UPF0148 family)